MLTLRNWEDAGVVRSDLADNMLADANLRGDHVRRIVETVAGYGYPGVDIDYRGIHPDLRAEYTAFITELADALHQAGKQLSVRLELPVQIAADRWDTGAYDWRAIGAVADTVKIAVPGDPNAYVPGQQMDAMLQWAVGEVNRHKIQLLASARGVEQIGGDQKAVPFAEAFAPFSQITVEGGNTLIDPGGQVTFTLAGPEQSTAIQFDPNSGTYFYAYVDPDDQQHIIWLENASSIARKLAYVPEYNLRGMATQNLIGEENDGQIWNVFGQFRSLVVPPVEDQMAVVWQVRKASGEVVAQASTQVSDPRFTWRAPAEGGEYIVTSAISSDGGATAAARGSVTVVVNAP
jgi:spore germination protein YaaH